MSVSIGFPKEARFQFQLNGRHFRVGAAGVNTIERLIEIFDASSLAEKPTWLLARRDTIREIESLNCRSVLSLIADRTSDPKMRLLAVWLRGRCGGYIGTTILSRYTRSPSFQLRKETARALNRLSAWSVLAEVAESDSSERIRRIATPPLPKPHSRRLEDFSRNVQPIRVTLKPPPIWISPEVRPSEGKRPKSVLLIRQILEHIHALVTHQSIRSTNQENTN
ncbi:MAG: HEAT repeat domain-containing protein [Pirellulaceae bacterium]|nr:HEAT repeat domain-containing protein [Pirellulaceae bacterium]